MAKTKVTIPHAEHIEPILPETPELEALLQTGYGMTIEEARRIVAERERDPHLWPWEDYKNAKAMLEAYSARAEVISTRPGWKRTPVG